ncbi:DUF2798 domain-containing protein [Rubellimicrobium arenae]|uniref:DUF2798 domain-containing protein n=1 Tax=Rubellimicrobium arenae TaxID=2817372 RepID=UPI001B30A329|nr:DUF2798 domain-containing protein [Rubellimicrobium arenae]
MTQSKATIITAQVFISCMMAFLMTGIFTAIPLRFQPGWVAEWLARFVLAWPVAFVLSLGVGPVAFRLAAVATRLARRPGRGATW